MSRQRGVEPDMATSDDGDGCDRSSGSPIHGARNTTSGSARSSDTDTYGSGDTPPGVGRCQPRAPVPAPRP